MSKKRRVLTFIAALTLYALTMPISAFAATTIPVKSGDEFRQAVQTVNTAVDNEYIIELTDDIVTGGVTFRSPSHVSVRIVGNEHTLTLKKDSLISLMRGAQLNLGVADGSDTLKISGGGERCNDLPGMLYIQDRYSTCNMYPGVTIADRIGNNYFGGGVTVRGGTFHMYGGIIEKCGIDGGSNCSGGGVAVINGGLFTMDGGEIRNCFVTSDPPQRPGPPHYHDCRRRRVRFRRIFVCYEGRNHLEQQSRRNGRRRCRCCNRIRPRWRLHELRANPWR